MRTDQNLPNRADAEFARAEDERRDFRPVRVVEEEVDLGWPVAGGAVVLLVVGLALRHRRRAA